MRKLTTLLILTAIASTLILTMPSQTKANPASTLSILNPGPASKPTKWTAAAYNTKEIGTSNFTFYAPQTIVSSTFFINLTIADVTNMKAWGIGVVYDNTTLEYVSAWRPTDHVFAPVEAFDWTIIAPAVSNDAVNATHRILKWGCAYIMGDPTWCFNGTGTLGQMQFKIIGTVNATSPTLSASFGIDLEWTDVFFNPTGKEKPTIQPGYFSYIFDTTAPQIDTPTQTPSTSVQPNQPVVVSVNVTDPLSGVKNVTLYYKNDTTLYSLPMALNSTSHLWQATIPGHAIGTNVKYKIEAYDEAGNNRVNDNAGAYFPYTVVPEFTAIAMLLMFAIASLVAVIAKNRNRRAVAT